MHVFTLCLCACACACVCLNNVRQNRKERLLQKRWSHIDPHLIGPLDEKEVSLKVNNLNHLFPTQ